MDSTEAEADLLVVDAAEVDEDFPTLVVVEVLLHLSEVTTVGEAEDFRIVVGSEGAPGALEEGRCLARLSSVPTHPLL